MCLLIIRTKQNCYHHAVYPLRFEVAIRNADPPEGNGGVLTHVRLLVW